MFISCTLISECIELYINIDATLCPQFFWLLVVRGDGDEKNVTLECVFQLWKVGVHCPQSRLQNLRVHSPGGHGMMQMRVNDPRTHRSWWIKGRNVPMTNDQVTQYTRFIFQVQQLCLLICNSPTMQKVCSGYENHDNRYWKPLWQPCQRAQWIIS